jgi:glutaredoxin
MPLERKQVSELVGLPMGFGGVRWWFVCPHCHQLRAALFLPTLIGARDWACRQCHGLKYHSQRLEPTTRIERRMQKITRRVGSGEFLDFPWQKPKWMRWATFSRHYADWQRADEARDIAFCVRTYALLKRINPSLVTSLNTRG